MSPIRMSRVEAAVRVIIQLIDAFNAHQSDRLAGLFSEDARLEDSTPAPEGKDYSGRQAIRKYYQDLFQNSPTIKLETEELFGYGNRCIFRWQLVADETSAARDRDRGISIFLVRDGLIHEMLSYGKH